MELEEWFEIRSEELREQYCPESEQMKSVPIMVREAWEYKTRRFNAERTHLVLKLNSMHERVLKQLRLENLVRELLDEIVEYRESHSGAGDPSETELEIRAKQIINEV